MSDRNASVLSGGNIRQIRARPIGGRDAENTEPDRPAGIRRDWHRDCLPNDVWRGLTILAACFLTGCSCHQPEPVASTQPATIVYIDQPALALAYTPPAAQPLDLARTGRAPAAFIGYESMVTEFFHVRTDDRILFYPGRFDSGPGTGGFGRFERRAVSTRVGVRYR